MRYEPKTWRDHVVKYPGRYRLQSNPDGTIDLTPAFGEVLQDGDIVDADALNHLEYGLAALAAALPKVCPYDVGDLYVTKSTRHPAERWPGTVWTRIEAGRFLAAAGDGYALGSTGGAESVSLTADQNAPHQHHQNVNAYNYAMEESVHLGNGNNGAGNGYYIGQSSYGAVSGPMYTGSAGKGAPHENRPPYIAVNIWERTA